MDKFCNNISLIDCVEKIKIKNICVQRISRVWNIELL